MEIEEPHEFLIRYEERHIVGTKQTVLTSDADQCSALRWKSPRSILSPTMPLEAHAEVCAK